jgi:hypothetical protein
MGKKKKREQKQSSLNLLENGKWKKRAVTVTVADLITCVKHRPKASAERHLAWLRRQTGKGKGHREEKVMPK